MNCSSNKSVSVVEGFQPEKEMKIVVIGSSGYVGSAVLKSLAGKDVQVVATVRDPQSDKAKQLPTAKNITLAKGDLSEPASLAGILAGADVAFINTPGHIDRAQLTEAGLKAVKDAKVPHVVVVSVLTAEEKKTCFGQQFTIIEKSVKKSGLAYTLLRLPYFLDNTWGSAGSIKGEGKIYGGLNPASMHTPIALADIGDASAAVLTEPKKHKNKTYSLTTKRFSMADLAAAFTQTLGRPIEYVQIPYKNVKEFLMSIGLPEWQSDGVIELLDLMDKKKKVVNNETKDFKKLTGRDPLTVQQWVEQNKAGFQ